MASVESGVCQACRGDGAAVAGAYDNEVVKRPVLPSQLPSPLSTMLASPSAGASW